MELHAGARMTLGSSAKFLISAVARAERPGCKVDTVLILEGPQGAQKSTLVRTLCSDSKWFLETQADVSGKDALQQLRRRWIVELAELDALSRGEMAKVKAFFSTQVDTYRASYGRHARDYPRQNVFIGTTNAAAYLRDETGARRFWPVRVGAVDIPKLVEMRDQLWAEARARFVAGEPWHVDSRALVAVFEREQESRYQGDPWEASVAAWLMSPGHPQRRRDGVSTADVLASLGIETGRWTRPDEMRVGAILRRLGWGFVAQASREGARIRVYRPLAVHVVQEDVQASSARDDEASGCSTQPAQHDVSTHIRARAHARTESFSENGRVGCEVVQAADGHVDAPGNTDSPAKAAWRAGEVA
jgi:putative DNA primase/helicase